MDTYEIEIDLDPFTVDPDFSKYNYAATFVDLGGAKYDEGQFTYVGGWYVGDSTKPWPDGIWEGSVLTILSGDAEGEKYIIGENFKTDDNPPPGLPPSERLLEVLHSQGHSPASDGAEPGDYFKIQSGYGNIKKYITDKIYFEPGFHAAQTIKYVFEVENPYGD